MNTARELTAQLVVFIAFRLLVCLGRRHYELSRRQRPTRLHCLSAFGLFGTPAKKTMKFETNNSLHCLSAFGLFGTTKVVVDQDALAKRLHCLSAFGLFGTL